ncbi:MAG: substrate-binding domain-containing protein [Mycetocola sp.]
MSRSEPQPFGLSRRERILDELRQSGSVRIAELAQTLGVSELTVRRDVGALADRGLLTRVHGGATLRSRLDTSVPQVPTISSPRFRVGMVVPSLSYYWPHIAIGARAAANEGGVQLILRGASYEAADQREQISRLLDTAGLHGLIVAPETAGPDGRTLLHWLDQLPLPVVLAERRAPSTLPLTRLEWVSTDHVLGGALAAEHIARLGHRRVGVLSSRGSPTSQPLRHGWERALHDWGLEQTIDHDVAGSLDDQNADDRERAVNALLDQCSATGTTALLVHADPQAVHIVQHARDRGWTVPGDLSIIAYDDEVAASAEPPITALRPPKQQVGRLAIETMIARLSEGPERPVQRTLLLPELRARASTAPPRTTKTRPHEA